MENTVETEQPKPEPEPQEPAPPAPTPAQPQPAGQPGVQSDQESDATSTVEVTMEQLTLGRPLAAQGLQIKPRKPVFTTLTMLTAIPANPKAQLHFRRDGKPARVRLLESSGDQRIDEAVLNSLYRWRAAGKKLRELERGETIPVTIRIMLGRR
jgi:outer membrane biosynthesis protein TonB